MRSTYVRCRSFVSSRAHSQRSLSTADSCSSKGALSRLGKFVQIAGFFQHTTSSCSPFSSLISIDPSCKLRFLSLRFLTVVKMSVVRKSKRQCQNILIELLCFVLFCFNKNSVLLMICLPLPFNFCSCRSVFLILCSCLSFCVKYWMKCLHMCFGVSISWLLLVPSGYTQFMKRTIHNRVDVSETFSADQL